MLIKNQGVSMVIANPASTGTRNNAGQGFDLVEGSAERVIGLAKPIFGPGRSPTDKVSGKHSELLLELHAKGRTNEMPFQGKYAFALFDASFNGLTFIILVEPLSQTWRWRVAIVKQS